MARRNRFGRRRSRGRSVGRAIRHYGGRARNIAREHREDVEEMVIGGAVGAVEGFTEANRENQGKDPEFEFGGTKDANGNVTNPHKVSVGNLALIGGAVGALATKNKKAARLMATVGTAGATLSARRAAYDYEKGKK